MEQDELNLKDFFRFIRDKIFIIIALVAVAVTGANLYTRFMIKPEYKSDSKILIEGTSSDSLINNYREIINSRTVLSEAIKTAGMENKITSTELMKGISISSEKGVNIFTISVIADNASDAKKLNEAVTENFIKAAKSISLGDGTRKLSIFDSANFPSDPQNINYLKTDAIAAAVTLLVSIVVLYLVSPSSSDAKEKTEQEILAEFAALPSASESAAPLTDALKKTGKKLDKKSEKEAVAIANVLAKAKANEFNDAAKAELSDIDAIETNLDIITGLESVDKDYEFFDEEISMNENAHIEADSAEVATEVSAADEFIPDEQSEAEPAAKLEGEPEVSATDKLDSVIMKMTADARAYKDISKIRDLLKAPNRQISHFA